MASTVVADNTIADFEAPARALGAAVNSSGEDFAILEDLVDAIGVITIVFGRGIVVVVVVFTEEGGVSGIGGM